MKCINCLNELKAGANVLEVSRGVLNQEAMEEGDEDGAVIRLGEHFIFCDEGCVSDYFYKKSLEYFPRRVP